MGLLSSLTMPRVSARNERVAGHFAPKPIKKGTYRSVPPLNERHLASGEVQSLPNYGKLALPASSTGHAGIKNMQISRKSRHESEIEAYNLRRTGMEVDLEARTGRAGRDFRKLISLNDEELATIFDEMADDFLLDMEMQEVGTFPHPFPESTRVTSHRFLSPRLCGSLLSSFAYAESLGCTNI